MTFQFLIRKFIWRRWEYGNNEDLSPTINAPFPLIFMFKLSNKFSSATAILRSSSIEEVCRLLHASDGLVRDQRSICTLLYRALTCLKWWWGKIISVLKRYSAAGRVSGILCLFGLFNNANSEILC